MEIKYRMYPHPVLWDMNDDYQGSIFSCDIDQKKDINSFILEARFKLLNETIQKLIDEDKMEYALHIESPATSYRVVKSTKEDKMKINLKDDNLLGRISLCPFVVAKQDIYGYENPDLNEDYENNSFDLEKGDIVAIGKQMVFNVDKETEDLSKIPSIFVVYKKEISEQMPMEVEINSEKIRIGLNINDYEKYAVLSKSSNETIDIMNSFLIFPALIYTMERLKESMSDYEDYRWYKALKRIIERSDMKFNSDLFETYTSLEIAQKIMNYNINTSLGSLISILERDQEEEI